MSTEKFQALLDLANHYPSPHNGQPIVMKSGDGETFELYFEKTRGLQAAEVSYLFSYVTMGVFLQHFTRCAKALGYELAYELALPPVTELHGEGLVKFAAGAIRFDVAEPDDALRQTLLFRQTSRKKYTEGLSEEASARTIATIPASMKLMKMDRQGTRQAIWLNQRAVFDDMFDDAVRQELDHWLRYSPAEKETKKDGLAYDCMELNGRLMKFIVQHYKVLHWPGVSSLLRKYYLRTMSDNSDVYYLLTPFTTEQEAFDVGLAVMRIWEIIAAAGFYLHPFGTIMSNQAAHNDFLKIAHVDNEDKRKNFLVFIYRAGKSAPPHASLRIPVPEHLLGRVDHV